MSQGKNPRRRVVVTALIGLALGVAVLMTEDIFSAETTLDILRILTDAFTVPGLLLMGAAGLVFGSERGAFDGVGYGLHIAVGHFVPGASSLEKPESFYDYVERKREKNKKGSSLAPCLFFTGLAFFLVSLVLLVVYFCNKG